MTIRSISWLAIILVLTASAVAQASTYRWRDDNGVTHFTDDADRIPERYLKRARELPTVRRKAKLPSSAATPDSPTASSDGPATPDQDPKQAEHAGLNQELKTLREALPGKKAELVRLHHKWSVARGRTPSEEEIKEFEKKRAAGKVVTSDDNPYVNKSRLSTSGAARGAYFRKLVEVRKDEERIHELEKEL